MRKGIFSRGLVSGMLALALCATLLSPEAKAVTYGSTVADPTVSAPWVVSIWNSPTNDVKDAEFRCTGTLISPHTVLTAAHCTLETGAYFVKVKSQALNDQTAFTTVSGVWTNTRYDAKTFVNDIGLLKLDDEFPGITYPSLANGQAAKAINPKTTFQLYGWGIDQAGQDADLLKSAKLNLQDVQATKDYKSAFNAKTMISAGRKIAVENVWSGACNGDSGGPLTTNINGITVVAGVTSWGEKGCKSPKPTVFSRVSYYYSDIQNGLKSVELKSSVVNRTAPVAITYPQISGNLAPNGTLTCDPGQWKNSVSNSITWTLPKRLIGTTTPSVRVLPSDAGQVFSCTVIISTKSGTIVRKVLTKQSANAPILTAQPAISGVDLSTPATAGSTLRCDGWNWDGPVDNETIQWFLTSTSKPSAPINGQLVGSSRTLSLDANLLNQIKGRFITCDVTGTRNSFGTDGIVSIKLNPLDGPTISSVNVSGSSLAIGSTLTCLFNSSQNTTSVAVNWGTSPDGINFNPFPGLTGNVLQINSSVIQQGAGKVVACQIKVTNSAGQAQRVGIGSSTFPSPPPTPAVSISNSGAVTANSYLSCSAQVGGGYYGPLTYQWGITSALNSTNFVGGPLSTSSSLSMNSNSYTQAQGNYLTCVASASNDAGSSSGAASVYVAQVLLPLPTLNKPLTVGESTQANTLTESIGIPLITGFDATKMALVLSLSPSGGSCASPVQINTTPSTISCSGLQPSTNYGAQLTVSYLTGGNGATQVSPTLSFTTAAIQSSLYVCSTTCIGSLTSAQLSAETADQMTIQAKSLVTVTVNGSQTGAPITHSTCVGLGCSPGTAPSLPVSCGSAGVDTSEIISNVSAQITTAFRYCKPNALDTIAPIVTNNSLSTTGYAPIIPTTGAPATSIQVRFGASDNIGIASTNVRLVNPGNVAVVKVPGTFLVGSVASGTYQAYLATASSGPTSGDVYQIQAQATDAAGNSSSWVTIGTFTVQVPQNLMVASLGALITPTTIGINYSNQIVLNGFNLGTISGYSTSFTWTVVTKNSSGTVVASQSSNSGNQVYITNLNPGTTYSVYLVATDSTGATKTSSPLVTSTLAAVTTLTPSLSSATSISNGFTAQITNYDPSYTWAASITTSNAPAGAASVNGSGLLTVSGLTPGLTVSVTVTASKTGASQGLSTVIGTSLSAPTTAIQVVVSPMDASGIINIGYCFTNSSAVSGTVSTTSTISGPGYSGTQTLGNGSFAAYSGMPNCPSMVGTSSGLRLAASSTFTAGVTAIANGVTYTNSTTWTTAAAVIVIPPASMSTSAQNYGTQTPGRNFSFTVGISGASSVTAIASNGTTTLTAPFLQGPSGDNWIYATSGGSAGTTGYTGSMAIPASATSGTYSLTYIATNSAGVATQFNGGNFFIPQPTSQASVTQTYFTGAVQQRCQTCTTAQAGFNAIYWEIWTMNTSTLSITATNGTDVLSSPESAHGGRIEQNFDYGNGVKKWYGYIQLWPGAPTGTYNATWIVTDSSGLSARFSAGSFSVT